MTKKRRILVIGHSHMHALSTAAPADERFEFVSCWERRDGVLVDKEPAQFQAFEGAGHEAVVFLVGGNQHIILGLVNHPLPPFDFHLPERLGSPIDPSATLLPVSLVERCLKRHLAPDFAFVTALARMFPKAKLCQVEPPPPLPTEYVEQYPHAFETMIKRFGVSSLARRHKLWRLQSKVLEDHGAAMGIAFIAAPAEAQDGDGSLAEPYRRSDPTHANSLYGALVLNQITKALALTATRRGRRSLEERGRSIGQ